MDKIKEISPNNYALLCNGESLSGFYKIEKIAEGSHYYCLWPTHKYFYLYHIEKGKYALNSNIISIANKFVKIENFAEETGSFVAYRENDNFAHLIFEDGYVETKTFSFVGKEIEGIRTVKTCSNRWFFYDTRKRKYLPLTGTNGYKLDGNLETILTANIFVINKNNKGKQLVLYNEGKAPVYSRDNFDFIELVNKSTYIGKLYQRNLYCIIKNNNIAYPFGYYTGLPKYFKENSLFIALKGDSYCIIKGEKEIQNHQWVSPTFIFHDNYILNKQKQSSFWKIYNINDGQEIPTNLKNIQLLDDHELTLSVTDNEEINQKIHLKDIEKISYAYIQKLVADTNQQSRTIELEQKAIKQNETIYNNIHLTTINENINDWNKEKVYPTSKNSHKSKLPIPISYYAFLPWSSIKDNHLTAGSIKCDTIKESTFIAWFVLENQALIITESTNSELHNIIFIKKDCTLVKKIFKDKKTWTYRQLHPITCSLEHLNDETIEKELSKSIEKTHHSEAKVDNYNNIQDKENVNATQNIKHTSIDYHKSELSISIKYYVFVPSVSIIDNRIINGSINCDILRGRTCVVWFAHENHTLIITESRRTKVHDIIHIEKESTIVKRLFANKLFCKYKQLYPTNCTDLNTLEKELSQYIITKPHHIGTETNNKSNQLLKKQENNQINITENIKSIIQEVNTNELKFAEFSFDNTFYKLKLDDVWDIKNIFYRKRIQYRQIDNVIAILYDFSTDKAIKTSNGCVYYHIYGEGKDKRFDQFFGQNTNSLLLNSINDTSKRIFLFKRNAKDKLLFHDEVKCVNHYKILEEDSDRTIIFFKLMSLLRYPAIDEKSQKETKENTNVEDKATTNKIEIYKSSNQTNMSKLKELYETREKLLSLGIAPNADLEEQLDRLEEEIIQNEIVPNIVKTIEPILKPVKRKVILAVEYNPDNGIHVQLSQRESVKDAISVTNVTNLTTKNIESSGSYKKLKVTFPDGSIIYEKTVIETLALTIQKIGAEKVAQLCEPPIDPCLKPAGVNLVTKNISPKYENLQHRIENGWLIFSCTNTSTKKRQIEIIAKALDIKVLVEFI